MTVFEPERPVRQAQDGNESLTGPTDSPEEPYLYMVFENIGYAFYDITGKLDKLDEAIDIIRKGVDVILDPQLSARLATLERQRITLTEKSVI